MGVNISQFEPECAELLGWQRVWLQYQSFSLRLAYSEHAYFDVGGIVMRTGEWRPPRQSAWGTQ